MADVNVSVMADRTPILWLLFAFAQQGHPKVLTSFSELRGHKK